MGMCTKENGSTIKLKATEYTRTSMAHSTTDNGGKISRMEKEKRLGLMEQCTREIILWGRSTAMALSAGRMDLSIKVRSFTTTLKDKVCTSGQTGANTWVTGATIKWMAVECSLGQMDVGTRGSISKTRSRVLGHFTGQTTANT